MAQLLDNRPERAIGMKGRALVLNTRIRLAGQGIQQPAHNPRLADAGPAHQQDALAFPALYLRPAIEEKRQFLVAANHRQDCAGPRLEPAFDEPLARDREGSRRLGEALERLFP